jgi:putative redox protein
LILNSMESNKEFILEAVAKTNHTKYQTTVTSGSHTIITDEPADVGGKDTGMSPYNLLLASLASCTAITLRMYIDRKTWLVDDITVNLQMFRSSDGILIESKLSFNGKLTDQQLKRLVTIADACPIHKILAGNIVINTSV